MRRFWGFVMFLWFSVPLLSQVNHTQLIRSDIHFRGDDACKIVGECIHLTYLLDSLSTAYLHYYVSYDGQNFTDHVIDQDVYSRQYALPTIEVLASGRIIIFYIKEVDDSYNLFQAFSDDNGETFTIESLATNISEFASGRDGDELYLAYKKSGLLNLSYYGYFTNTEYSENSDQGADVLKFTCPDILYGPIYSNDDIWIQNRDGWPTFFGPVTTAGRARVYPSGNLAIYAAPWENIFLGGLKEQSAPIILPENGDSLQANAVHLGYGVDIVYVKMEGSTASIMYGNIIDTGEQQFDVFSWFPDRMSIANAAVNYGVNWYEDANLIYQNHISILDTLWTYGPTVSLDNNVFWVEDGILWIEGEVEGNTTWGCANDVYLTGDITYVNTTPGVAPDDPENLNTTDYFGLISGEKIIIKYKHRDPFNNFEICDDNCNDIILYGAFAATEKGDSSLYGNHACHYDGMFTFEYQHPHGSTPNFNALSPYTGADTTYSYIDLHKYIFPIDTLVSSEILDFNLHGNEPATGYQSCGYPYESNAYQNSFPNNYPPGYIFPYGTDYPWYNPIWPESNNDIVYDRGTVHIWGSLVQRRRGFMRRSGADIYNHPSNNHEWDLENYHYGGTHAATGYCKDYHNDSRLCEGFPAYFPTSYSPQINPTLFITRSTDEGNNYVTLSTTAMDSLMHVFKALAKDNIISVSTIKNYVNLVFSTDHGETFSEHMPEVSSGRINNVVICDNKIYLYEYCRSFQTENKIYEFDPITLENELFTSFSPNVNFSNFSISDNQNKVYAYMANLVSGMIDMEFHYSIPGCTTLSEVFNWDFYNSFELDEDDYLFLNFNQQDYIYLLMFLSDDGYQGNLAMAYGSLPNLTGNYEHELPSKQKISLSNYPNPFNPSTTITFSVPQTALFATIEIY
ncbi:MAG TPA: hypothetical protein PLD62_08200, partial [Candidatus Cloacimonadota bacterium]|nr:hypothetical protein [Candidatus Cloacimonadota bacterium]